MYPHKQPRSSKCRPIPRNSVLCEFIGSSRLPGVGYFENAELSNC